MTVNCVVVTYNRLNLLKENLTALDRQSFPVNKIILIDNCSTDGTYEYLQTLANQPRYRIIRTDRNVGGAGGFSLGIRAAVEEACDYTWIMDDDTIPSDTALEELVNVARRDPLFGFVCSHVNWTDGTTHVMNKIDHIWETDQESRYGYYRCEMCTFVSVLLNNKAIYRLGLPIKEFFLWCDDTEYSLRISGAGYACYYAAQSIVEHKTPTNHLLTIDRAPVGIAWRFYYQFRNSCYMTRIRKSNILLFYLSVFNKYRRLKRRLKARTEDKDIFLKEIKRGFKDGLTFNPKIDYISRTPAGASSGQSSPSGDQPAKG